MLLIPSAHLRVLGARTGGARTRRQTPTGGISPPPWCPPPPPHQTNPRIEGVWNVSIKGNRPSFMKKAFEDVAGHLTADQAYVMLRNAA